MQQVELTPQEHTNAKLFYGEKLYDSLSPTARESMGRAVKWLNKAIDIEAEFKAKKVGTSQNRIDMAFKQAVKYENEAFGVVTTTALAA